MMLVLTLLVRGGGAYEFTSKAELKAACEMWMTDQSTAQATYGHISTFGTGQITDMSYLFCGESSLPQHGCNTVFQNFDEDVSGWNMSQVTTTVGMFSRRTGSRAARVRTRRI